MTWVSREQALRQLGVKAQTLYSYVSRGQVARQVDPNDPRRSLYRSDDLAGLASRRERVRRPTAIAASTIDWGEPIIATAITTVADGRLYYRGQDAAVLSRSATVEVTAGLLWGGTGPACFVSGAGGRNTATGAPRQRAFATLAARAGGARPSHGRSAETLAIEAAGLVADLAGALGADDAPDRPLHVRFGRPWRLSRTGQDGVRRALVLLADQELSTSAFAARVAASTGASLAAAALAGLAALSGPLHGDTPTRVRALLDEARQVGADATVERFVEAGLDLPGFGHPLYPGGDPRAAELLFSLDVPPLLGRLIEVARAVTGREPTIDVALLALADRHRLPSDAPFSLFALGRSLGWMAHAIEQATAGALIRPRARYTGAALRREDGPPRPA